MAETTDTNDSAKVEEGSSNNEDDGYNVVNTVSLQEWVDHDFDHPGEYVHLIADRDNRELRCYRAIAEPSVDNDYIKTTIEDVKFRYYFDNGGETITSWYLNYGQAHSFMTYCDLMNETREGNLLFKWNEASGGTMMDDERTTIESLTLTFNKDNGTRRTMDIRKEWQSARSHKMANVEGDVY